MTTLTLIVAKSSWCKTPGPIVEVDGDVKNIVIRWKCTSMTCRQYHEMSV